MQSLKIAFPGSSGDPLAARLELPLGQIRSYAIFAHCFTCSKDLFASRRIASELAMRGIAVLRFDFTGLGASGGEFANSQLLLECRGSPAGGRLPREAISAPLNC